jgi:hypothetical protein
MTCIGSDENGKVIGAVSGMTGFRETIHFLWSLGARFFEFVD